MSLSPKFLYFIIFFPFCTLAQTFTSSNLPLVVINTNGKWINDDPKITANMGIIWNGVGKRNSLTDPKNNYNGNISIEARGSSSQGFPKRSYGFETKSLDLMDMDVSLLGMPEENDWVLYAPYTDKTMIRDVLTYTLDASMGHYSPRCRYVELFLNGNYEGVYVLMEKIKRNENRVDIAKLLTTDNMGENLTGGYIIKIDKSTGGGGDGWFSYYINNTNNTYYQYDYPKSKEITPAQKTYIQTYVRNMEKALYLEKFSGTGSYHEYLNDSSFIDFMIINELSKNIDGLESSKAHFGIMDDFSREEQLVMLRAVLKRTQEQKEADFERLMTAYLEGDSDKISALDEKITGGMLPKSIWAKMKTKLLDERNVLMAERSIKAANEKPVFVAVGASHLAGKTGLIESFKKAGFKLSKVAK